MKTATRSHPGKVRPNNEDSLFVDEGRGFLLIADGMGGTSGGEVASAIAAEEVSRRVLSGLDSARSREETYALLLDAVLEAHGRIRERTAEDSGLVGMGTTLVAALVRGGVLHVVHVGDSRAYLIRRGEIRRLTEDHTIVAQIAKSGMIGPEEARTHKLRHVLSQALGSAADLAPGMGSFALEPGDLVLLCTDGLTDMLPDGQILSSVTAVGRDLEAACGALVDEANRKGGKDNITVVLGREE